MNKYLDPEEVLLDASNLPSFNKQQFEGQIERPIGRRAFSWLTASLLLIVLIFFGRTFQLQIVNGEELATRSANNTLRRLDIFADRGIITDRLGTELAWNDHGRRYITQPGFAHLVGYISKPKESEVKEEKLNVDELIGRDGAEKIFNSLLRGTPGIKIEEVDVAGKPHSDYLLEQPVAGENLTLAVDARLQSAFYHAIDSLVSEGKFVAGSGVMLDVNTGEIIALVNNPEYDQNILVAGDDREKINKFLTDERHPFLNRAVAGLYTPGSVIKPIMATAALTEKLISPDKQILSTGQISIPNPYFPDKPTVFKDWKAHGWVDLRHAIAVSSDVYFYAIGGGYADQKGLGIAKIDQYAHLFGLGEKTGSQFAGEAVGLVPTPEWKRETFDGADWLLGNTYHTVIGQYGFQVTPLQVVRAIAAIANGGHLVTPTLTATEPGMSPKWETIPGLDNNNLQIVREGMRLSVREGTAVGLNMTDLAVAGKTGTAELGASKQFVNSWVAGFFPYENPRYAFTIVMEKGSHTNLIGATYVMRQVFDWMRTNTPEYFKS